MNLAADKCQVSRLPLQSSRRATETVITDLGDSLNIGLVDDVLALAVGPGAGAARAARAR